MKTYTVKEIMVPIAAYATVAEDATLAEAIQALELAQTEFDQSRDRHRAIVVLDDRNQAVGKISQHDVLMALEPDFRKIKHRHKGAADRIGLSDAFIKSIMEQYSFWEKPLANLCKEASTQKVKHFMYTPCEGEYVDENATLDEAIHRLVIGEHHSLLVTRGKEITGVLRLTDVFELVFEALKYCRP